MVGQISEGGGILRDPIPDRRSWVAYEVRRNLQASDLEAPQRHVVQRQPAGKVAYPHREKRRRKVPSQALTQIEGGRRWSPDVHVHVGLVEGIEEA